MEAVLGSAWGIINPLIAEIAAASSEQSEGVEEINKAILQAGRRHPAKCGLGRTGHGRGKLSLEDEAKPAGRNCGSLQGRSGGGARSSRRPGQKSGETRCRPGRGAWPARFSTTRTGGFKFGDFYVFVLDKRGIRLAHGGEPALCGRDEINSKDADGKDFIRDMLHVAQARGRGWCDYRWANPNSGRIEQVRTPPMSRWQKTSSWVAASIKAVNRAP